MRQILGFTLLVTLCGPFQPRLAAQAPGVPIEENATEDSYADILKQAIEFQKKGSFKSADQVRAMLGSPTPAKFSLVTPATKALSRPELARRARAGLVRVGWLYRDEGDDQWQLDLAGGYSIAEGGIVATCRHVVDPDYPSPLDEGYLIAADSEGHVVPIESVLAADDEMDAAIVRLVGGKCTPLALNDQSVPGDAIYVFSDPMGVPGYFSEGMINRYYWFDPAGGKDPTNLAGARNLRIHVSADWAPGSSGAPVLDDRGNAIGHVSEIESLLDDPSLDEETPPRDMPSAIEGVNGSPAEEGKKADAEDHNADDDEDSAAAADAADESTEAIDEDPLADDSATMMVLHAAVSARGVRLLAEQSNAAAAAAAPVENAESGEKK